MIFLQVLGMPKQCEFCEEHTKTVRYLNHHFNQNFETDICQASDYLDDDQIMYVHKWREQWGRYTRATPVEQVAFEDHQDKLKVI